MATNILDLAPELVLMVSSYLDNQAILNIQLINKHLRSLSLEALCLTFFSERRFDLSLDGFRQLHALSVHPYARHVKTIIIRVKSKTVTRAKYLTLLDSAFHNFAKYGKLTSIGVRRDASVLYKQHFDVAKKSHAVMREFLISRMVPAAIKAMLPIKSIIYDFVMCKDQMSSQRPLVGYVKPFGVEYEHREEPEAAGSIEKLHEVVPKHLSIVVRFIPPKDSSSEYSTATFSLHSNSLTLVNTSIFHHDCLQGWLLDCRITSLSLRRCDIDNYTMIKTLQSNPIQSLAIINTHQYSDENPGNLNVWKRVFESTCTRGAWASVFSMAQALPDLTYIRLGQLWVGMDEEYMNYSYEADGREKVEDILTQLLEQERPLRNSRLMDETFCEAQGEKHKKLAEKDCEKEEIEEGDEAEE